MPAVAIPAPVGGWNARDALDKMPATDAVRLDNWIPRAGYVESRKGFIVAVTEIDGGTPPYAGLGGAVETLIPYRGTSSTKLLAAADNTLWDVTTATASDIKTSTVNDRWQFTPFDNLLILTNGGDTPQVYNGTSVTDADFTGSPGGFTATEMWGCNTFKGRVYYWGQSAQSFWYAAAGAYQGALAEFDLSTQLQTGGTLVMMLTWTLDAGDGVDDLAVFVFSTGEVLLYQGDDPGDANAWSLVGRFQIGVPLGIRASARVGGTQIILTRDGYVDLAQALRDGRYSESSSYSNKIIRAAKEAANTYSAQFGWQAILYPASGLFLVNVPISTTESVQHVRETASGSWCSFSGLNARCFAVHDDKLYFGTADGNVYQADIGAEDNGGAIDMDAIPAFNSMGSRAQRKQMTACSVVSTYQSPGYYALDCLTDFSTTRRATVTPGPYSAGTAWDITDWDVAEWSDEGANLQPKSGWRNLNGIGYALTVSVRASTRDQTIIWYSTNVQYRNAGVI